MRSNDLNESGADRLQKLNQKFHKNIYVVELMTFIKMFYNSFISLVPSANETYPQYLM